jgi:hypothetical protein
MSHQPAIEKSQRKALLFLFEEKNVVFSFGGIPKPYQIRPAGNPHKEACRASDNIISVAIAECRIIFDLEYVSYYKHRKDFRAHHVPTAPLKTLAK